MLSIKLFIRYIVLSVLTYHRKINVLTYAVSRNKANFSLNVAFKGITE